MEAKIEAVLRKDQKNALGQFAVSIKVVKDKKRKYVSTRCFIDEGYWLPKSQTVSTKHPDFENLNAKIGGVKASLINEYNKVKYVDSTTTLTPAQIADKATGADRANLFVVVKANMERKKGLPSTEFTPTTLVNYTKILNRLDAYYLTLDKNNQSEGLLYADITVDWLKAYHQSLIDEKLSFGYINGIFRMIRTFISIGITDEKITYNPFKVFKVPGAGKPQQKERLTLEELELFENKLPELSGQKRESVLYFLFGCYSGLRVSDWYKFNRKLHLTRVGIQLETTKTDTPMFVPYHPPLRRILELMKDTPLITPDTTINKEIKKVAADLKIKKHLSTHCGRKTFAVTICSDQGISCEVCAMYMGITVKVCVENYYKVTTQRGIDEAEKCWHDLK